MQGSALEEHPEWYAVNRRGESTAEKSPYVPYYRFLCPSRGAVGEFLAQQFRELTRLPVQGLHFDYIRYPDVILPVALWSKYNLVQDREYPEFDFCYCDVCRASFKRQEGIDPLGLDDPSQHSTAL